MNYELAKQLQKTLPMCNPEIEPMDMTDGRFFPRDNNNYIIDLSRLIQACDNGGQLFGLEKHDGQTINWHAYNNQQSGNGSTPEEAVAKLWLELNK